MALLTSLTLVAISFTADAVVDGFVVRVAVLLDVCSYLLLGIVGAHGRRWMLPRDADGPALDIDGIVLDVDGPALVVLGVVLVVAATESLGTLFRALASIILATPFCVLTCTA